MKKRLSKRWDVQSSLFQYFGGDFRDLMDNRSHQTQKFHLEKTIVRTVSLVARERSCLYKLRFGTYPRGPPFFGSYRGHYPIVEFEIWPFQPRVKLSLSTMRPLIDIFSRCSCNVALARFVLFLVLSLSLSFSSPASLSALLLYPTSFFFSLLGPSRVADLYKDGPECFYSLAGSRSPSTWFILNPCACSVSLSPRHRLQTRFCVEKKWCYETRERFVALWSVHCTKFRLDEHHLKRIDESLSYQIYLTRSLRASIRIISQLCFTNDCSL